MNRQGTEREPDGTDYWSEGFLIPFGSLCSLLRECVTLLLRECLETDRCLSVPPSSRPERVASVVPRGGVPRQRQE